MCPTSQRVSLEEGCQGTGRPSSTLEKVMTADSGGDNRVDSGELELTSENGRVLGDGASVEDVDPVESDEDSSFADLGTVPSKEHRTYLRNKATSAEAFKNVSIRRASRIRDEPVLSGSAKSLKAARGELGLTRTTEMPRAYSCAVKHFEGVKEDESFVVKSLFIDCKCNDIRGLLSTEWIVDDVIQGYGITTNLATTTCHVYTPCFVSAGCYMHEPACRMTPDHVLIPERPADFEDLLFPVALENRHWILLWFSYPHLPLEIALQTSTRFDLQNLWACRGA